MTATHPQAPASPQPEATDPAAERALHPSWYAAPQPSQPEAEAQKAVAQPRLIGWRTDDYMMETSDPAQARNWAPHHTLLPIFEGDTNTKLVTPSASAPLPEQRQEAAQVEAHALAEEAKTAWGRQDPKRLWIAIEALEALATPPASSRVAAPTTQAVKVPLTDEQIDLLCRKELVEDSGKDYYAYSNESHWWGEMNLILAFARAIEAAHGIQPSEGERSHD